jgi:hypothetical protein
VSKPLQQKKKRKEKSTWIDMQQISSIPSRNEKKYTISYVDHDDYYYVDEFALFLE